MNYTVIFDGEKIHSDIKNHSDGDFMIPLNFLNLKWNNIKAFPSGGFFFYTNGYNPNLS
jgi:hypothetical protein